MFLFLTCLRYEEFDLFSMVPGNWTHFGEKNISVYISEDSLENETQNQTIKRFTGFYDDAEVDLTVLSPISLIAKYNNFEIPLNFSLSLEGVAFADTILPNGLHLSVGGFSRTNCEITLIDKEQNSFTVVGLMKTRHIDYTLKDFLIPTGIAIALMIFLRKVVRISF